MFFLSNFPHFFIYIWKSTSFYLFLAIFLLLCYCISLWWMQTLLAFVNFKLYHSTDAKYPPILDPRLEALAVGICSLMHFLCTIISLSKQIVIYLVSAWVLQIFTHFQDTFRWIPEPPWLNLLLLVHLGLTNLRLSKRARRWRNLN